MRGSLRSKGVAVEVHDDHLPLDAPDEDWIALVGREGWVAVTKDKRIRYRASEYGSIEEHLARVLVLRTSNAKGPDIGRMLASSIDRIARFAAKTPAPFLAGIYGDGTLKRFESPFSR